MNIASVEELKNQFGEKLITATEAPQICTNIYIIGVGGNRPVRKQSKYVIWLVKTSLSQVCS